MRHFATRNLNQRDTVFNAKHASPPCRTPLDVSPDKRYVALIVLLLLPYFEPGVVFAFSPTLTVLFKIAKMLSIVTIAVLFLWKKRCDALSGCALALAAAMLGSCLITGSALSSYVFQWFPLICTILLVSWASPNHLEELAWAAMILTASISLINLLTMLALPQGTYDAGYTAKADHFFYGHRNASYQFVFISVGASWLLDSRKGRRFSLRTLALLILGAAQIALAFSATTFLALVFGVVFGLVIQARRSKVFFNGLSLLAAYIISFVALVFFRVNEYLGFLINGLLGKSTTLTGRTAIWDQAIKQMDPSHLLFGYGFDGQRIVLGVGNSYPHPHNEILAVWVCGGTICAILFIAMLLLSCRALYRHRSSYSSCILCVLLGCFLIVSLTETIMHCSFGLAIALAFYWNRDRGGFWHSKRERTRGQLKRIVLPKAPSKTR